MFVFNKKKKFSKCKMFFVLALNLITQFHTADHFLGTYLQYYRVVCICIYILIYICYYYYIYNMMSKFQY